MLALNRFHVSVAGLACLVVILATLPVAAQVTGNRIAMLEDYHGYYPCMDCHEDQETIATPRILEEEHFEPLAWEDDQGNVYYVPFGQKVVLRDLLGQGDQKTLMGDNLERIGARLNIGTYMENNDLSPADSVWTLVHGGGNLWCLDCHATDDRNKLTKMNGELLSFNQSQLLCGECHGPILRDWDKGIHGKTVGYWDPGQGEAEMTVRLLCVECHLPHRPAFRALEPMPAPVLRIDGPGHKAHQDGKSAAAAATGEAAH